MNTHEPERLWMEFSDPKGLKEQLPVTPLGEGRFRLEEMPAFAYRISAHDVVTATQDEQGSLRFAEVVEKSGNRTVRFLLSRFPIESEEAQAILAHVTELGCRYNNLKTNVVSIMVPPQMELDQVVNRLREARVWWEYSDPRWDDLFRGQSIP
jgi:hypothetical protein